MSDYRQPQVCPACATGVHAICRAKGDRFRLGAKYCGCATCFPAPLPQGTVMDLLRHLAYCTFLCRDQFSDSAQAQAVKDDVLRAVRTQFRFEDIKVWSMSYDIARLITAWADADHWSQAEFDQSLTDYGFDIERFKTLPYVPVP